MQGFLSIYVSQFVCKLSLLHHFSSLIGQHSKIEDKILNWILVEPNGTVSFSFEERGSFFFSFVVINFFNFLRYFGEGNIYLIPGKNRHRDTHKFRSHQIMVKVEGWLSISPVTVDRVGVYFREAFPNLKVSVSKPYTFS